jgi:fructose-1-phosphate kinase PfkB-like protein
MLSLNNVGELMGKNHPAINFEHYPNYKLTDLTGAGDSYTAGFAVSILENDYLAI